MECGVEEGASALGWTITISERRSKAPEIIVFQDAIFGVRLERNAERGGEFGGVP